MRHDIVADMFCIIKNAESKGKSECVIPASKVVKSILQIMHKYKYIGDFEYIEDGRGGKFRIKLLKKINDANVIKPRFAVKKDEFIKFEKRYLPAVGVGLLIVSTPKGVMDQNQAKKDGIGGKLLGYVY
jgi:small subunit ribosomal protein S8